MGAKLVRQLLIGTALVAAGLGATGASGAQVESVSDSAGLHAGQLEVPLNKSQVLRLERPYAQALIGNDQIADVLPLTDRSLYVLGKQAGATSLTLYDKNRTLIAVVDVVVGPDLTGLRRQLSELIPGNEIGARQSNGSIILSGIVSNAPAVNRAVQIAETYAPGKVVNMLSVGASQQVMLEVRFSEVRRANGTQTGVGSSFQNNGGTFGGAIGGGASITPGQGGLGVISLGSILDRFGIITTSFDALGLNITSVFDALERRGLVTTLAEPTLVALSGETASFLAGGEFPIPVSQGNSNGGNGNGNITVEFKPFGVSLAFTPTVLEDGVISLVVAPEVSSIDAAASININGLSIPGLQTRRAQTTVELRDGESFAMAGLLRKDFQNTIRQFPLLGSLPIIGALFRSAGFQKEETELVIIVTPRLVRPVPANRMRLPSESVQPANELELFLNGQNARNVAPAPLGGSAASSPSRGPARSAGGIEGAYGHIVR